MSDYYSYKKKKYTCGSCKWEGPGRETILVEAFEGCMEIGCPKCQLKLDVISFPGEDDVLKFGSKEDKDGVRSRRSFLERLEASYLKDISRLPDLSGENMVFNAVETEEKKGRYISVFYERKQIWKEMCGYEYYERFIQMGGLLKKKYGDKMIDLVPPESVYLYGDRLASVSIVEKFRKSLGKPANVPPPLSDFEKGLAFYRADRNKEAIACFEKVLEASPNNKEALNLLGQALYADGQHSKAVASLRKALKIDPDYALGYYDLATIMARQNKRKEALVCYEKCLELKPPDDGEMAAWALYSIACIHALDGQKEEALNFFEQSLAAGLHSREHIEKDKDLAWLRRDPRFIKLMKKYF